MSEVFDCTTPDGLAAGIEAAARAVQAGQIVVLPTDTVYGIGCDAFDGAAVSAVLAAKGRGGGARQQGGGSGPSPRRSSSRTRGPSTGWPGPCPTTSVTSSTGSGRAR